jgi:hypothetical protein
MLEDQHLVDGIKPTSQEIYDEISKAKSSAEKPVSKWLVHAHAVATAKNLQLLTTDTDFKLCANFKTNQSGGAKLATSLNASDIPRHPAGLACYKFPVSHSQSAQKDTQIYKDLVVVNIIRPNVGQTPSGDTNISTYSLVPAYEEPVLNVNSAQVVAKSGAAAVMADIKIGSTISAYYEMNILNGDQEVYKIVIEDPQVYGHYCEIVTTSGGYNVAPNPACPPTVKGLTLQQIDAGGMLAKTSTQAIVQTRWTGATLPAVFDSAGRHIKITDIGGAKVDLVMNGEAVAEIHKE